jgi:hypothetical protein
MIHKVHHHVRRAVHHMRGRPEHHKHIAAYGVAIAATAFIATLWSVSFVHAIKSPSTNKSGSVISKSIDELKKTLDESNIFGQN